MKHKSIIYDFLCGLLIGVCMLIPGVSGGTVAVILGIYSDLLDSTATIFTNFSKAIQKLFPIALGGLVGFFSTAHFMSGLLSIARVPTLFFFMGTIIGGIMYLVKKTFQQKEKISVPMALLGVFVVIGLNFLPAGGLDLSERGIVIEFLYFLLSGILLGAALILPGISFSMMLVTLDLYDSFLLAVETLDLMSLLPLAFSTIFGVIVLAKVLSYLMKKASAKCNGVIIGFVLASLSALYPGISTMWEGVLGILMLLLGTVLVGFLPEKIKKKKA